MMSSMRKAAKSWVAKALFLLLVASFAAWGAGPVFSGGRVQKAATAGKVTITASDAQQTLARQIKSIEQSYGFPMSSQMIAQLGLRRTVVQQMVMQSLYDQESYKMGLVLDEAAMRKTIAAQTAFRDAGGKFSPALFQTFLQNVNMTESAYLTTLRSDVSRTLLMGGIRAGATAPEQMARAVYAYRNENRTLQAKFIAATDMKDVPTPTPDELTAYYNGHKDAFMAPEYRKLSVLMLSQADLSKDIQVTDDEAKSIYDSAPDSYAIQDSRDLLVMAAPDKALVEKFAKAAATGKPFEELAKEQNVPVAPLNGVTKSSVTSDLVAPIFSLPEGAVSDVITTPKGFMVIKVKKAVAPRARSFDEVKAEIIATRKTEQADEALQRIVQSVQDALAGGAKLSEVAEKEKAQFFVIPAVSKTSVDEAGKPVTTLGLDQDTALEAAFNLSVGETSQPIDIKSGVMIVGVDGITPTTPKPMEKVQAEVLAGWKLEKQKEAAIAQADSLVASLKAGAKTDGFKSVEGLTRDGEPKGDLPKAAVVRAFESKVGDVFALPEASESKTGTWVLKLAAIVPADQSKADLPALSRELKEQMANDLLDQFGLALRTSYGVTINDDWVNQSGG